MLSTIFRDTGLHYNNVYETPDWGLFPSMTLTCFSCFGAHTQIYVYHMFSFISNIKPEKIFCKETSYRFITWHHLCNTRFFFRWSWTTFHALLNIANFMLTHCVKLHFSDTNRSCMMKWYTNIIMILSLYHKSCLLTLT